MKKQLEKDIGDLEKAIAIGTKYNEPHDKMRVLQNVLDTLKNVRIILNHLIIQANALKSSESQKDIDDYVEGYEAGIDSVVKLLNN